MTPEKAIIRADFDFIARFTDEAWDHNQHYHNFLLKHIPLHCSRVLEIGCGTGTLARKLALRAEQVLALDLSPEMIRRAREHSRDFSNIEFQIADAETEVLPAAWFDCVVSVATLHHLPLQKMLEKLKAVLKPGGVLVVLDLYKTTTLADILVNLPAIPVNWFFILTRQGFQPGNKDLQQAYMKHLTHDSLPTLPVIRSTSASVLPGVKVQRHLLWRYSLIYTQEQADKKYES